MPNWLGLLVPAALSLMVCTVLAGRRVSPVRLSLAVIVSQSLFHLLFVLGATGLAPVTTPGHDHAHMTMPMPTVTAPVAEAVAASGGTTMWLGHAVAAAVTIAALLRGERALRALTAFVCDVASWLRRRVAALAPAPAFFLPARRMPHITVARPSLLRLVLRSAPRRGPPLFVTV